MELEAQYSFTFPSQFRQFLINYNGGYTPKTKFKIGKLSSDVRGFYGVGRAELNYSFFTGRMEFNDYTKSGFVPIACDSFGNYIVIAITGGSLGQMFFEDHEQASKRYLLAPDFASFIKACKSELVSEASKRSIQEREEILIKNGRGHVITDSLRTSWQAEIDKYSKIEQEELIL